MNQFKPRTTAPLKTDKNYIKTTHNGYNYCIDIKDGYCMPNCVGYAWGRWREILGEYHKLSRGNAENWYGNTADGYKRGSTPKLGAVICWRKGKAGNSSDGAGHVAIVEEKYSDGSILISNSAYKSTNFYTKKLKAPNYSIGKAYTFQGFIYLPVEFEEKLKSVDEIAQEVIAGKWGSGLTRKNKLTKAGYNYSEVQAKVNEILKAKKYIKTTTGVWCRKGVGFKYAKYKVIPKNTKCELLGKNVGTSNGYKWDKVIYNNETVYLPNNWNKYL